MKPFLLLVLSLFLSVAHAELPKTSATPKTVRLLTIGNSFSKNATNHLDDLALASGHTLVHTSIVVAGASLQLHAEKAQKHEANPLDKEGLYKNERSLKQELTADAWDFITIQQASIKSHDFSTYQPFAGWLRDYIIQHAPKAKILVHQTWAYRKDDPRFLLPPSKPGEPTTQEEMYRGLTAAYTKIAAEIGAGLIPVGDAFFLADTDPKWAYQTDTTFDPKSAQKPSLPNQTHSIHVGWFWPRPKDGKEFPLTLDGHHANLAGEYLGACVWYEVLFGESVVGNPYVAEGLQADHARFLQETAHKAVQAHSVKQAFTPKVK
jgi:hypothetical protein